MVNTLSVVLPNSLIKQIVQRAGGNPFFIEEVIRSLFDQGVVVRREERFEVTEKASTIAIPPTIADVLMARIDRLEEPTRHLVKVASVIGRSFFYRVLSDVASEVEDIPGKLAFLREIQILQPQERMGEEEYLFKHALAQEAAYESILPPKRRELHLMVAHSIEKIFKEKLSEFYGMLAYHYSRAEDREKTEEYLIKAGEEALRSAASDEALHYYEEALQLYLKKFGPNADPEKVAMLEKNIALALYNRGQHQEAVKYFDHSLEYFWGRIPRNGISSALRLVLTILYFIATLYLPFLARRRVPRKWDTEIIDIFYKKCKALAMIDPKRFFIESFYFYKKIMTFDLSGFENGLGMFVGASALFSFTGISFRLSSKILNSVKDRVSKADLKNYSLYELIATIHNYLKGDWQEIKEYEDDLVKRNCRNGEIYEAVHHLYWHAQSCIAQGSFDIAEKIIGRLDDIFKAYQYDLSKTLRNDLKTNLLGERRRLNDALITSQEGIDFEGKTNLAFWMDLYSWRAFIYTLMGNMEQADECLQRAERIRCQINAVPLELSGFWRAKSEYNLQQLKKSMRDGNKSKAIEYRKKALQSVKETLRIAKKVAYHRAETYKQVGIYYWLIGKQKKGLNWWQKTIVEAQRLGARPELARIYSEVGKHLYETNSKYKMLNGIKADEYLYRARTLFEEMNLQWDLDELSRVARV